MIEAIGLVAVGLGAGLLAAAIGVGGGVIFVPALVVLFSFDQVTAQGTSLAVIFPTAIVATIGHARAHRVRWPVTLPLAAAGIVGGVVGARLALYLEAETLRRLFAGMLFLVAVQMAYRTWRLFQKKRRDATSAAPDGC